MAGEMEDIKLGTFEACLEALRETGGDKEKAQLKLLNVDD